MADKFIRLSSGQLAEREAAVASAGAGDAGRIVALDGAGKLDSTVMPNGIGADTAAIVASEALAAGDLVNIHDATGAKVRKADASNGRRADGFVLAAVTSSATATVYFDGSDTALTGLTIGATYYLSGTAAGTATLTPPSTSGHIVQEVGRARLATALSFEPEQPVTLA